MHVRKQLVNVFFVSKCKTLKPTLAQFMSRTMSVIKCRGGAQFEHVILRSSNTRQKLSMNCLAHSWSGLHPIVVHNWFYWSVIYSLDHMKTLWTCIFAILQTRLCKMSILLIEHTNPDLIYMYSDIEDISPQFWRANLLCSYVNPIHSNNHVSNVTELKSWWNTIATANT